MRDFLRVLLVAVTFIGSCLWWRKEGGYEPAIAIIACVITLIEDSRTNSKLSKIVLNQKGGPESTNYQAGGNMIFNNSAKNTRRQ